MPLKGDSLDERLSGEGGIRTLEAGIPPPNALAGRRLQPLGHFSEREQGIAPIFGIGDRVVEWLRFCAGRTAPRRGGRAVECGGLENRFGRFRPTRVQIPPPPLPKPYPEHRWGFRPRSVLLPRCRRQRPGTARQGRRLVRDWYATRRLEARRVCRSAARRRRPGLRPGRPSRQCRAA